MSLLIGSTKAADRFEPLVSIRRLMWAGLY